MAKKVVQKCSATCGERFRSLVGVHRYIKLTKLQYFYGTRAVPLYPHTFELSFDEVLICKIGGERLPIECLPFGMKIEDHRTKVMQCLCIVFG